MSRRGLIDVAAERRAARGYVDDLRIKTSSIDADVGSLSGGNQQKVALARWLETDPSVLILDEPTQGVDVGSKAEIHDLMGRLAERGVAIVMISSEMPEILGMSDRIAVMRAGRLAGTLARSGVRRRPSWRWPSVEVMVPQTRKAAFIAQSRTGPIGCKGPPIPVRHRRLPSKPATNITRFADAGAVYSRFSAKTPLFAKPIDPITRTAYNLTRWLFGGPR